MIVRCNKAVSGECELEHCSHYDKHKYTYNTMCDEMPCTRFVAKCILIHTFKDEISNILNMGE